MTDESIARPPSDAREPAKPGPDFPKMPDQAGARNMLTLGLKILGEVALSPGASLLADGKVTSGIAHVGIGFIARRMLGFPGVLLVGANSYSQSVTGKSLLEHVQLLAGAREETLGQRVKKAKDENKSLGEILALVAEDVEDKYHSHASKT
jgi:hypothetical protein